MTYLIPVENVSSKIVMIQGHKVMIDRDLAELYCVETKQLKRSVRRNIDRFPEDFMFEMTKEELNNWGFGIHPWLSLNRVWPCSPVSLTIKEQSRSTSRSCGSLTGFTRCMQTIKI